MIFVILIILRDDELLHQIEFLADDDGREVEDFVDFIIQKKGGSALNIAHEPKSQYDILKGGMKGFFKVAESFHVPLDDSREYIE